MYNAECLKYKVGVAEQKLWNIDWQCAETDERQSQEEIEIFALVFEIKHMFFIDSENDWNAKLQSENNTEPYASKCVVYQEIFEALAQN